MLKHSLGKKSLPDIQSKALPSWLRALFLSPVTGQQSEEVGTCPSTFSSEDLEDLSEVSLESPLG